ncbi:GroES-like protein [Xylaria cf. heliscus]|nr:GroES-like protein [Xylaria cf. heliscus]
MENPSVILHGPHSAAIEERPIPALEGTTDVIIRIAYVGVCGSDVHFWHNGGSLSKVHGPIVMGHEAAGTVHAVGPGVTHLAPGDRVALEPGIPCRKCRDCKAGSYNICRKMVFAASPPHSGTLTKFYGSSADFCYKIPDSMSLQEAVLIEPLAVAVHGAKLAGVRFGHKVVVFGAGTVGLFCAAAAKHFGAALVLSIDILENKLAFAKTVVGTDVGRTDMPDSTLTAEENARRFIDAHDLGDGADIVIDASGAEASINTGIHVLRSQGVYVQVGMGRRKVQFPISEVCDREIVVKGSFRYGAGDYETAMRLVGQGFIDLKPFITNVFPFEKATDAWDATARGEGIKNMIEAPRD